MKMTHLLLRSSVVMASAIFTTHAAQAACPTTNVVNVSPVGIAYDYTNLQTALQTAANFSGGGTVVLSGGTFAINPTAPLQISSNVVICSNNGAVIKSSKTPAAVVLSAGDFYGSAGPVSNVGIQGITFDNGIVIVYGTGIVVTGNTFQNIGEDGTWGALGLEHVTGSGPSLGAMVYNNQFKNLASGGITAFHSKGITLINNVMTNVKQGVSVSNGSDTTDNISISGNSISGITRMGIEVLGAHGTNLKVRNNRLTDWVMSSQYSPLGLSIVSGNSADISGNTLVCGAGCGNAPVADHFSDNRDCDEATVANGVTTWVNRKGWGLEIAGVGSTTVQNNTVEDFATGIVIGTPTETVSVSGNAIYRAIHGIDKAEGPTTVSALITGNQIENARSAAITGAWNITANPVISQNLITRAAGAWSGDATCRFHGVVVSEKAADSAAMVVDGNRFLFEGTPVAGFVANAITLAGYQGNLTGTDVKNNFVVNTSATKQGNGLYLNAPGSSTGVKLSNNSLQNLASTRTGSAEDYYASKTNNVAINMTGDAIFTAKTVSFVPSVTVNPSSVSGTGSLTVNWSETNAWAFATAPTWYLGDGGMVTATSTTRVYSLPAKRTVRLLQASTSGVMSVATAAVDQQ